MSTLGIFALVASGVTGIVALLVHLALKSSREAGKLEERNAEQTQVSEAKDRSNEVLAERRDPSDADKRLRDGTF